MPTRSSGDVPQITRTQRIIEAWGNNIAFLINIGLLIFLIMIASYATMELAARIAARGFVDMRMQEVRTQLGALAGQRTQITSEAASPAASSTGSDISALRVRESELKVLSESIVALEYAGANDGTKTVYALQTRYESFATRKETQARDAQLTSEAFDLERRVNSMRSALERLDTLYETGPYRSVLGVSGTTAERYFDERFLPFHEDLRDLLRDPLALDALEQGELLLDEPMLVLAPPEPLAAVLERQIIEITTYRDQIAPQTSADLPPKVPAPINSSDIRAMINWLDQFSYVRTELGRQITLDEQRLRALSGEVNVTSGTASADSPAIPKWAQRLGFIYEISFFPSDIVLAIVVISCGAIGSLFAGLRAGAPSPATRAPIGAVSGFVTFAVIKGGKFLFIVQTTASVMPINPYAAAFSGLLAGLFTERAYRLLESLVDKAAAGIEKGGSAKKATPEEGDLTLQDFVQDQPDPVDKNATKPKSQPTEPPNPHDEATPEPAEVHKNTNPNGKKPVVVS